MNSFVFKIYQIQNLSEVFYELLVVDFTVDADEASFQGKSHNFIFGEAKVKGVEASDVLVKAKKPTTAPIILLKHFKHINGIKLIKCFVLHVHPLILFDHFFITILFLYNLDRFLHKLLIINLFSV